MEATPYEIDQAVGVAALSGREKLAGDVAEMYAMYAEDEDSYVEETGRGHGDLEADATFGAEESGHNVPTLRAGVGEAQERDEYGLTGEDRSVVNAVAKRLERRTKHLTKAYMVSGPDLVLARNKLAKARSGAWSDWVENETDLDYKQVLRIINAYERTRPVVDEHFGGVLGEEWRRISLTAFYRFAKLKPHHIKELIELAKSGQKVRPKTVNELFGTPSPAPKSESQPALEGDATEEAGLGDTRPKFGDTADPIVGLVQYFRSEGFDCLVRASDTPFEGPFAVLFYRGDDAPVSNWNECGRARPAGDVESLLMERVG